MLRSHLTLAVRHALRNKVFSLINIGGVAVALTASFFIVQYIAFESGFDRFQTDHERVYRVALEQYENGQLKNSSAKSYPGIYEFLNENLAEVETATRFVKIPANTGFLFGYHNKIFNESGGVVNADSNFFKVFPALLIRGDINTALTKPHSIVISESVAKKVFGNADPIGQQFDPVSERVGEALTVTGILKDIPSNAHFHAKFIARLEDMWPEIIENKWLPSLVFNYALLKEDASHLAVSSKINDMLSGVSSTVPEIRGSKTILQPITDIHLQSHFIDEYEANGNITLVYLLLGVGAVIMLMSWVNYINIETARFLRRSKEVGVRRMIGSARSDLAVQFLSEFFVISVLAVTISVGAVVLLSGLFKDLIGISLDLHAIANWSLFVPTVGFLLMGTVVTGIYPALYVIRLKPAQALKGDFNPMRRRWVRQPLLVIQFSASMVLIAFLLVINSQLEFMQVSNKKLEVDRVISLANPVAYAEQEVVDKHHNFSRLRDELIRLAAVERVETSSAIPGTEIGFTYVNLIKRTVNDPFDPTRYKVMFVGENFLSVFGIKLVAGRNFEVEETAKWTEPWGRKDWYKIIINEKAAKALGFKSPADALNTVVKFEVFDEFQDHEIIGVIEDYHHEAVKKETYPMVLKPNFNSYQQVFYSVRLRAGVKPQQAIDEIGDVWSRVFPEHPFEYFFLEDYYDQQFKSEQQFRAVFSLFAGVAAFIGCLGMLGMAVFESNARIREISIRKILGATGGNLLALLSRDQIKCLGISCLLALPLAWYAADLWLSTYPSRTSITVAVLLLPVGVIASTVSAVSLLQVLRTSSVNPVESLRNE